MTFPLRTKLEATFGDQVVDLTPRFRTSHQVQVKRGRANESAQVTPSAASFLLDNSDGALTPDHPMSPHWPHVKRGVECRLSVVAGSPHLRIDGTTGSRARTPDHIDLDFTGVDLFVAVDATLPRWRPTGSPASWKLGGQWLGATNRSWQLYLTSDGLSLGGLSTGQWQTARLGLMWSTNGQASGELFALSNYFLLPPVSCRLAVGAWIDVNNGAGGRTIRFYSARSLDELEAAAIAGDDNHLVGPPVVQAGTTSIFAGSAPLDIGDVEGSGFNLTPLGYVHGAVLKAGGPAGTTVANPDFGAQQVGATSFVDTAPTPKTWTLGGSASISNVRTRMVGQIVDWRPSWPHGPTPGLAVCNVTVAGVMRRMAQGDKALQSALYRLITSEQNRQFVLAYWPWEDEAGADSVASPIPGVQPMGFGGEITFAGDSTQQGSKPLAQASGGQPFGWNGVIPPPASPVTNWAVDHFLRIPTRAPDPTSTELANIDSTGTAKHWRIALSDTNMRVSAVNGAGADVVNTLFSSVDWTSDWTVLRLRLVQDGGNVDWAISFAVPGEVIFGLSGTYAGTVGRPTRIRALDIAPPDGLSVGHIAVTTGLDFGWLSPADRGWAGESAGSRLVRLCSEQGIALVHEGDPIDTEPMGPQRPKKLLDLLRECESTDGGILGEQIHMPGLAYRSRSSLYNQDPRLTLDVAAKGLANPYEPVLDDQRLRNHVEVQRDGGSSATAVDDESIATEGTYDTAPRVNSRDDSRLPAIAAWRLHVGTWPGMRVPAISSKLVEAPGLIDDWLELGLGDKIRVQGLPPTHPPGPVDQLVDGTTETIAPMSWTPSINGQPAGPWEVWILEDPVNGRVDTVGSELAVGVDEDDTSWSVASDDEGLWITTATHPAMFPFEAETFDGGITGERFTVTAISGASSPQTWTVVRGGNGIMKAHPAGTTIRLAHPARPAL